jgi:hypothetical protein
MGDEMDAMRWNVVGIDGGGADERRGRHGGWLRGSVC